MASTIKLGVNVTDNGSTGKVIKSVEVLHTKLKETSKTASEINVGGSAGSRKLANALPSGASTLKDTNYNKQRSVGEGTGASSRDFAKQAQGLGGLVHLYATYAANIFAVGAAFRALSEAMNTTNMVKGLNQLGAASGMALGNLSKDLVTATDGALSLRQSMESVAKASSSGMSAKNIMRMGEVAKKASQALGIDMADAMSRITRAATKLEPELVDELGLFTKTGKASEEYAKSVGKSVSELTDFERRMAYSNALLAEGEKKFGAINIDTNPYTKLVASIKDVAQSGLELINKVLVPIVDYLSKSPTALTLSLAGIGTVLLRQAIPAIGQFKAGLASAAEEAKQMAVAKAADAATAMAKVNQQILAEMGNFADDKVDAVDAAERKVAALQKAGISKASAAYKLLQMDIRDVTKEHIKGVEDRARVADKGGQGDKAKIYREVARAVWEQKEAEDAYHLAKEERLKQTAKEMQQVGVLRATMAAANKAQEASTRKQIISNAAYNGSLVGVSNAMKLMSAEIDASGVKLTRFGIATLKTRGYLAAVGGAVTTMASAISGALGVIGVLITVFTLVDSTFSKNGEAVSAFNGALTKSEGALKTYNDTLKEIDKKDPLEAISVASLSAKATAITGMTDSVAELVKTLNKADEEASGWDRFLDGFKTIWGGDLRTKFKLSMYETVFGTLNKLAGSPEAKVAKDKLAKVLEIDPNASEWAWKEAFARVADNKDATAELVKVMNELGISYSNVASKSAAADNALKASSDIVDELVRKFKSSDEVSNFGNSLIASSIALADAMDTPEKAINKLMDISIDVKKLSLFDSKDQSNILKYASEIKDVTAAYNAQKSVLQELESKRASLLMTEKVDVLGSREKQLPDWAKKDISATDKRIEAAKAKLAEQEIRVQEIMAKFPDLAANQFAKGAKYVEVSISAAMAKASTEFTNAVLGTVGDLPGVSEQRTKIALQQINADTNLLKAQLELITATKHNTAIMHEKMAQDEVTSIKEQITAANQNKDAEKYAELVSKLTKAESVLQERKGVSAVFSAGNSKAAMDMVKGGVASGNKEMMAQAGDLLAYVSSITNLSAQISAQADKAAAAVFSGKVKALEETASEAKRTLEADNKSIENQKQLIKLQQDEGKLTSLELISKTKALDVQKASNDADIEKLALNTRIGALQLSLSSGALSAKTAKSAESEIASLREQLAEVDKRKNTTQANIVNKSARESLDLRLKEIQFEETKRQIVEEGINARKDAELTARELALQTFEEQKSYSEEYLNALKYDLEAFKINEEAKRNEAKLTAEYETKVKEYSAKYQAEMDISGGRGTEESARLLESIQAEAKAYADKAAALRIDTEAKLANADATAKLAQEQLAFNNALDALKGLDSVFSGLGTSISGVATAMRDMNKSNEANRNTIKALEDAKKGTVKGSKEELALTDKIAKAERKKNDDEIKGYAQTVGAAKGMFKEKTAAHKALAATEKILHITRLGMMIAEMVADTTKTGVSVANSGTRMAASIAEAGVSAVKSVIDAIQGPFPMNLIAGAATAAVVFALLASIGGGGGSKPSAPPVVTSEQRQETQGTGQDWEYNSKSKQYEKVDVGGGVFGDSEAKVDSINRALEIISENSVMGLSYDNKMLRAMEKIASSITGAAEAIYAVPGIRSGKNFGTMAEETFKGNWTSKVPVVGKLLGSVFGGGTSANASIEGAGIQLRGTLDQLANDTSSAVKQYKDVMIKFKEDGGWFSSDKKWTERRRETETLESGITSAISDVFKQSKEMFTAMAKQAGMSASTVEDAFASMSGSIDIDLMGLKGEEVVTELNAAIGSRLNLAAESLFSMFEKYREFGEGMVETVARVTDTNAKVSQVIENVGSIGTASLQKLYDTSEAIVDTFGSLESFIDKSNFFAENFLDDAAKLLPYQKAIARTFADIGMAIPKSKKEFATLVQSLNLASESGRETYRVLMDVAPAFDEVANSAEDSLKKLKDGFGDTISSLTDFIKKIAEFKASLVLGGQSTLTPAQKYIEARKQFDETYANLASTDTAVAKAARDKFTTTASTFLDTSRGFFASSAAYTADFDTVMARLTSAEAEAKTALTVAEQQLAALEISNNYLGSISSGISQIVASIGLSGALGTILPTQAAANGGYMQGLTLVGEKGAEVVDFKSPGRVYSANQTSELFRNIPQGNNNAALVREVSALRQEVVGLRNDQHKQTGDLIMSNYDANRQNSEEITTAITDANEDATWSEKALVAMK